MEDLKNHRERVREIFKEKYGCEPRLFRSPGRVNLIGEHTDYNNGFVLPFAIDRETVVAGSLREDSVINIDALDIDEKFSFDLREPAVNGRGNWIDYVEGVTRCLQKRYQLQHGADLVFSSTVPIGGGLSSSAALEVSIGFALLQLNEVEFEPKELAFAAQEAEHQFVGIRSGIMDQFTAVFGRKDHGLLLDCRSLETKHIPLNIDDGVFVVCDTKVKHELASSEYNSRREECEKGVELLRAKLPGIKSLRDVSEVNFQNYQDVLPTKIRQRCQHVITENARTLDAAAELEHRNLSRVGELMYLSHESLRDDYEVSCPELDTLVEIAREVEGVYGARMTGGGFGGCTVNLLRKGNEERFKEVIVREYKKKFSIDPGIYIVRPSDGATELFPR